MFDGFYKWVVIGSLTVALAGAGVAVWALIGRISAESDVVTYQQALVNATQTIQAWEGKYDTAVRAQKTSEATLNKERTEREIEGEQLVAWQNRALRAERKIGQNTTRLARLEVENAKLGEFLRSPVPLDIWCLRWPESDKCSGEAGRNSSGNGTAGKVRESSVVPAASVSNGTSRK